MLNTEIPFEIHITTGDLSAGRLINFIDFCHTQAAKPLMIELSKGDFIQQPMLTIVVYADAFEQALSLANDVSNAMDAQDFPVKRLKIEVPAANSASFSTFGKYFEWHGKTNFTQVDALLVLCEKHKVHLSLNSLKNEADTRFITLREFGTKMMFETRIAALLNELKEGPWTIIKQQSEYCIYDNNKFLDNGWLPQ